MVIFSFYIATHNSVEENLIINILSIVINGKNSVSDAEEMTFFTEAEKKSQKLTQFISVGYLLMAAGLFLAALLFAVFCMWMGNFDTSANKKIFLFKVRNAKNFLFADQHGFCPTVWLFHLIPLRSWAGFYYG